MLTNVTSNLKRRSEKHKTLIRKTKFEISGYKELGIRTFKFVTKTQNLYLWEYA